MMRRAFAFALGLLMLAAPAAAVTPEEMLQDPALELRAREISKDLRCLVCQNQSIDDSDAPLAHDLRILVRQRLMAGDSNEEAVAFIVERYGDFVLLDPPFKAKTLLLWIGPALLLAAGGAAVMVTYRRLGRRAATASVPALTPEEARRVDELLKG